jgi:hypothetical protein
MPEKRRHRRPWAALDTTVIFAVALSDVSFWGEPPPRGKSSAGGAAVASQTPATYHRACPAPAGR